jgi:protein-tyrosine-phosphatase
LPAEKVLFVCIGNAGRSQMAQAFAERAGFQVRSAGSRAESHLHPEVVEAMGELGFDLAGRVPHQLNDEDVEWADLVVTMGCGDACPVLPGKRYLDWNLQDPAGMPIEVVRRIRDRIAGLVDDLPSSPEPAS